jgi:hypothetical protein
VDRAALDAARELGLPCGGWCPAGRWAEDGPIPALYPLRETPSADPAQRTEWNVRDSDATLLLSPVPPAGGTGLTLDLARNLGKPSLLLDPSADSPAAASAWLARIAPARLNVAGPRESEAPGVYWLALRFLREALTPPGAP